MLVLLLLSCTSREVRPDSQPDTSLSHNEPEVPCVTTKLEADLDETEQKLQTVLDEFEILVQMLKVDDLEAQTSGGGQRPAPRNIEEM